VGARITVTTEHSTLVSQVRGGRSYLSASDIRVHFGLGNSKLIKSLKIRWPSGAEDAFQNLRANQILSIKEGVTKGKA
jgi:hypothetical protein